MDSISAFLIGSANRGGRPRVFDWDTAARRIKETGAREAAAGLSGDWEWTGGDIFRDGAIVAEDDTYTYLSSTWAVPELMLDGNLEDCWVWEDETEWDEESYWPQSARDILNDDVIDVEAIEVRELES